MSNLDEVSDETKENFTELLLDYVGRECREFCYWFDRKFETFYKEGITEEADAWEDFREFAFNDFDNSDNDFWKYIGSEELNDTFKVGEVMELMVAMSQDFNDSFDIQLKMTDKTFNSERRIWNTLAYWATFTDLIDPVRDGFKKKWNRMIGEKEEANTSRECDVCYEAKQIHACCASCKGKLLCRDCYDKVDNECPFCRRMMIFDSKLFRPFVKLDEAERKYGSLIWVRSESKEEWLGKLKDVCKEINDHEGRWFC